MMMMQKRMLVWCIHIDQVSDKVLQAAIVGDRDLHHHHHHAREKVSSSVLVSSSSLDKGREEDDEDIMIVCTLISGILQHPQDPASIRRFLFAEDRKRALLSLLLQRCAIKNRCSE
jgi:hypothetical protein